jgi:hypothetical protein
VPVSIAASDRPAKRKHASDHVTCFMTANPRVELELQGDRQRRTRTRTRTRSFVSAFVVQV